MQVGRAAGEREARYERGRRVVSEWERVVVTGMGTVTAAGIGFDRLWEALLAGRCFVSEIECCDTSAVGVHVSAEIKDFDATATGVLSAKEARRADRYEQFARIAAAEAWEQAGIDMQDEDPTRIGVCIGSGCGGLTSILASDARLIETGSARRMNPLLGTMMEANMAAGRVAIDYGLKGQSTCVTTACATGAHSIGEGVRAVRHGYQDVMVCGGAEAALTAMGLGAFDNLTALSRSEDPSLASLPFDERRSGFVLGEGAGVIVIESLSHARARGAEVLGEIVGFGSTCDAHHVTAPDSDADGAARAISMALDEGGIDPSELDYYNAHGTATKLNDEAEAKALHTVCGGHVGEVLVSSVKGNIGHTIAACGAIEACVTMRALAEGRVPGTCGCTCPDGSLDVWTSPETVEMRDMRYAVSVNLGFGGHNAALAFARWGE